MSMSLLGNHFDVHTGGIDHRELHHVNEIAHSEAFLEDDRPWGRYWLHNEFILLDAQKIAKSAVKVFAADGITIQQFNEPAGGQVVFHLHVHIIPRKEGIALKPPADVCR